MPILTTLHIRRAPATITVLDDDVYDADQEEPRDNVICRSPKAPHSLLGRGRISTTEQQ